MSGKDKYCFNKQLAKKLFRIKKKNNFNSTSLADCEPLDESDEIATDTPKLLPNRQSVCFLEGIVWENSSGCKWGFKGCPPVFLKKENNLKKKLKNQTHKRPLGSFHYNRWTRLCLLTSSCPSCNGWEKYALCRPKWVECCWQDRNPAVICVNDVAYIERENENLTGKLTKTFMLSNGYYSCKYYM